MSIRKYIPSEIESKWQKKWIEDSLFTPDLYKADNPFYNLWMFPYPSGEGLHIGHFYASTGSDLFGRFKRLEGFDVFQPIGYDAFGIHSENYALKVKTHPQELIETTTERYQQQLIETGHAYDWSRTVNTSHSDYYKWTQWLFLQMYKMGLAYRKEAEVNWCPSCLTVLADEQVISGECERCSTQVVKKELKQWFFKITSYADKLLKNLDWIDWPEKIKIAQRNWIGRSEGIVIKFNSLEVFTTRPDTLFGATFVVISPEHPLLNNFITHDKKDDVKQYIEESATKSEVERRESKEKTGVFTGSYVKNPINGEDVPVWVADYVLMDYGTGAIMAVPAHDARDLEFAKKFNLPIKQVIEPRRGPAGSVSRRASLRSEASGSKTSFTSFTATTPRDARSLPSPLDEAYIDEGVLINSGEFNGLDSSDARQKIADYLEKNNFGTRQVQYHLRDWLISRQRYWGPPIPIIYCDKCGTVPVPEKNLPVELPYVEDFRPTGTGKSPLAAVNEFVNVKCPSCAGEAKRETDVSDTFLDSAWYFLRYPSTTLRAGPSARSASSRQVPFDMNITRKWLPVDMYMGGAEHAVLHLLYSRFVTMVLKDAKLIEFEEPFKKFIAHGLIIKEGAKMSKSKGNVINPDDYIKQYGADSLRTYMMFMGPYTEGGDFQERGIEGTYRFLQRIWGLFDKVSAEAIASDKDLTITHTTIMKVGRDIAEIKYNTAIAFLMEWLNSLSRRESISKQEYKTLLVLVAPFAPHITEELWEMLGEKYSIHQQSWPKFDNKYLEKEQVEIVVQVNGRIRDILIIDKEFVGKKDEIEQRAKQSIKVKKFMDGKNVKKSVYVEGKVINFVI